MLQTLLSSSKNLEIPTMLVLEIARQYLDGFAIGLWRRSVFFNSGRLPNFAGARQP
jgi:hypothetical protein